MLKFVLICLLVLLPTAQKQTSFPCAEFFAGQPALSLVESYCVPANTEKCDIDQTSSTPPTYAISCVCRAGWTFPDCSFRLPDLSDAERDPTNTLRNTCFLEDLLQIYQNKNDEIYGRYRIDGDSGATSYRPGLCVVLLTTLILFTRL